MSPIHPSFKLLSSGQKFPPIGFGTYAISPASLVVQDALDAGYRLFDSAIMYHNEQEVATAIADWIELDPGKNKREHVFYQTKLLNSQHGYHQAKQAIASSLQKAKRLGYIDMYLIHDPMSNKELRLETWRALQEAVDEGTVKSIGVSNFGVRHLEELIQWEGLKYKPAVNQVEFNPWLQRNDIYEYCRSHEIQLQAYSPLTQNQRLNDPELLQLSNKYGKSTAQILIRWCIDRDIIPLPKSSSSNHMRSNIDVFDFNIDDSDMKNLGDPKAYDYYDWDPTTYSR